MGRQDSRTGALSEEQGQAVVFVVMAMVAVIAVVGFVIDIGHAYQAQRSLQGAADAAALAGAQQLPDPVLARQTATAYGSTAAGKNHIQDVTVIPEFQRKEIEHFFEHYKDLEPGKWVKTEGWGDAAEAEAIVQEGIADFVPHAH